MNVGFRAGIVGAVFGLTLGAAAAQGAGNLPPGVVGPCLAAADAAYAEDAASGDGVAGVTLSAEQDRCLGLPPGLCRDTGAPEACLRGAATEVLGLAQTLRGGLPASIAGKAAAVETYARELAAFDAAGDPVQGCAASGLEAADCVYFNAAMRLSGLRAMEQLARRLSKDHQP